MFFSRFSFLTCWLIILIVCALPACSSSQEVASSSGYRMYVGTSNGDTDKAIYHFQFNVEDGSLEQVGRTKGLLNPSFLTLSPDNKNLYAIHRVKDQKEGGITAFSVNESDGSLTPINTQSTQGRGPCYVAMDKAGEYVMVANYGSGSVSAFGTKENGSLTEALSFVQHEGSSVNPERQKGPHAHYIDVGAGGVIYAADLGTDQVMLYNLEEGKLKAHPANHLTLTPGRGPRHIDYHPNGKFIFVLNELAGSITVFEYEQEKDKFNELQMISSLAKGFDGYNKSADIHVHPSGKFLYASNRGDSNSITVYSINQENGQLTLVEIETEGIDWPRNFAIDPTGKYLLAANRDTNSITSYEIDQETGALTPTGHKAEVEKPMCIKFVK